MLECRVFILSAGGRCFTRLAGAAPPAPDFLGGGSAGLLGGGSAGFLLAADFGLDALPIAEVCCRLWLFFGRSLNVIMLGFKGTV
jgi:hypothetical protein